MNYRQHNDTIIELNLTDRRGHPIRANLCHELKIRVWTQSPQQYIALYPRDIRQEEGRDILVIPDFEMATLPPGVIVYRYSFKEKAPGGKEGEFERSHTVVTNLKWRGMHLDTPPSNPVNSHRLEHLRELIEGIHKNLTAHFKDLKRYVEEEYTNNLSAEVDRATKEEATLKNLLKNVRKDLKATADKARKEDKALGKKISDLLLQFNLLSGRIDEVSSSNDASLKGIQKLFEESIESLRKDFQSLLDKKEEAFNKKLKATETKIEKEKSRAQAQENKLKEKIQANVTTLKNLIKAEKQRAKLAEEKNSNAITVINGDEKTIGSIKHALLHARHYTDDTVHQYYENLPEFNEDDIKGAILT